MEAILIVLVLGALLFLLVAPIVCLVRMGGLARRIERLERQLAHGSVPAPVAERAKPAAMPEAPPPPPERVLETVPPAAPPPPQPERAAARAAAAPVGDAMETEIALKWLGRVGVLALVIAGAFFLQYAFQNRWIGPSGQVALGILAGIVLLALGERNRVLERTALGEALTGGGLAFLYASIYAAHAAYRPALLGRPEAFGLMVLVTALGVTIAVRIGALSTAILATLGGFLTPILVRGAPAHGVPTGDGNMTALFGYLTVLDLGLLAVAAFRQWRSLQVLALVGTWLVAWGWMGQSYRPDLLPRLLPWVIGLFFIFALMPVIRNLRLRVPVRLEEMGLILANPAFFFPTLVWLFPPAWDVYLGACALVMAVVYLLLANLAWGRMREDRALPLSWLGVGLAFAVITVPLQLQGHWIMLGWAAEGAVLVWIGARMRMSALRGAGLALLAVVAGWLLLLYQIAPHPGPEGLTPVANGVFVTFLAGLAALGVALQMYTNYRIGEPDGPQARLALSMALAVLGLWVLTAELRANMGSGSASAFGVSLLWTIYGAAIVVLGMARSYPALRKLGLAVFGLAVLKVFLVDMASVGGAWRILSFVTLGAILVGISWLYHRYGERIRAFISSGELAPEPSRAAPGTEAPAEEAREP